MDILKFDQIKERLISDIRRDSLIPVIGSGFSRNCTTRNGGRVPAGEDFQKHMLDAIKKESDFTDDEFKEIENGSLSEVSTYYNQIVSPSERREYLRKNLTDVILDNPDRKAFLNLDWQYIYTLNIDDAIENNSGFSRVVYANREFNSEMLLEGNCVLKLHGDAQDIITYADSACQIFDKIQYVTSIDKNKALLARLRHDCEYQNIIYVSCSLKDEMDLSYASQIPGISKTNRYYCHVGQLSKANKISLERYKITCCIEFDNYDEMYRLLTTAFNEAKSIRVDELTNYCGRPIERLDSGYDINVPYLLQGKSPSSTKEFITIPNFFTSRTLTRVIISNMPKYTLQFLRGQGCTGKSYIGFELMQQIKDRDVYMFESKDSLSYKAFLDLLSRKNQFVFFDYKSLGIEQIEHLIQHIPDLNENNISIVLVVSKSDRDLPGIIKYSSQKGLLDSGLVTFLDLPNSFSENELQELNAKLVKSSLGVFDGGKSIVDNILFTSKTLSVENKYEQISPVIDNDRYIVSLIILAIKRKVSSKVAVEFDIENELEDQCKKAAPLIEKDCTKGYEISPDENSPIKYVLNASFWLCDYLSNFIKDKSHYRSVIVAFQKIVKSIIGLYGVPELSYTEKNAPYKDFILFDNITSVFGKDSNLYFIKDIYEALNDDLATDPNYLHQRSKCFIRLADISKKEDDKQKYLNKALRDANTAYSIFYQRYEKNNNEKVFISASHAIYTKALCLCHLCVLCKFRDVSMNSLALSTLVDALQSPFNVYEKPDKDRYNYGDDIMLFASRIIQEKKTIDQDNQNLIKELFSLLRSKKVRD